MTGYNVTIKETSRELTARERIAIKDTTDVERLDACTKDGNEVIITPVAWALLEVHNEKAKDDKDYYNYVIVDKDNTRYVTGSESFFTSFREIWDEMSETGEVFEIKAYQRPSKNYRDKSFITCSIV